MERLVLESPIGLEDYRLKVPYATNDEHLEITERFHSRLQSFPGP